MILKQIKYLLENEIFSNNITKKHILYLYRFIISGCPEITFIYFISPKVKRGLINLPYYYDKLQRI